MKLRMRFAHLTATLLLLLGVIACAGRTMDGDTEDGPGSQESPIIRAFT